MVELVLVLVLIPSLGVILLLGLEVLVAFQAALEEVLERTLISRTYSGDLLVGGEELVVAVEILSNRKRS